MSKAKRFSAAEFYRPSNLAAVKINQHAARFPSVAKGRLRHRGAAQRGAVAASARGE